MGRNRLDLTGKRFGSLLVEGFSHTKDRRSQWTCLCDCGSRVTRPGWRLVADRVKSCGCKARNKGKGPLPKSLLKARKEEIRIHVDFYDQLPTSGHPLYKSMYHFCDRRHRWYDPDFHAWALGQGMRVNDPARHKEEILRWVEDNGRLPRNAKGSSSEERRLERRLRSYAAPTDSGYDPDFRARIWPHLNRPREEENRSTQETREVPRGPKVRDRSSEGDL